MTRRSAWYDPKAAGTGERARFATHAWAPSQGRPVAPDHPAIRGGASLYGASVVHPSVSPRLLVDGVNQRKIGGRIVKGAWRGLKVYCLTLEERASCPRSCHNWAACMGNGMPYARRHVHGPALEQRLIAEVDALARRRVNAHGFAVRLHVLGDFYAVAYAELWAMLLGAHPGLHLFGFTAWAEASPIGAAVAGLNRAWPERCHIRFSARTAGPDRAITIDRPEARPAGAIICPVQTGATRDCGTCGLCWARPARARTIAFLRHGPAVRDAETVRRAA